MTTLYDLKNIIDFTFDIEDDEVCGRFYVELGEINEEHAKQIEVVRIARECVTCKLTDFLRRKAQFHPTEITKYLEESYEDGETRAYLIKQLTKRPSHKNQFKADITDDGGEALYHFFTNDMSDFLTRE